MEKIHEEQYGQLVLTNILASIWLGDWERYETIFLSMDEELIKSFPFHADYNREDVKLWYQNHFLIPGDYFLSPYYSSYIFNKEDSEERKKNLLCLIGTYEKMGFHFPLEKNLYPDHIGCIMAFIGAIQQEKIKSTNDDEIMNNLISIEQEMVTNYILPIAKMMNKNGIKKVQHPFFKEFLPYFQELLIQEYSNVI